MMQKKTGHVNGNICYHGRMGWESNLNEQIAIVHDQMEAAQRLAVAHGMSPEKAAGPYKDLVTKLERDRQKCKELDAEDARRQQEYRAWHASDHPGKLRPPRW